jgi:shikimate kinase
MESSRNIFLVGLMGAGKTTIGRQLARRLGKRFIDTDQEIEQRTGVRVSVIFEIEGEVGFRARETQTLDALTAQQDIVLATGGGAVLDPVNRERLASRGFVIYLRAHSRDLYLRTRHDKSRPLLQTGNPLSKLEELHRARDPLYMEVADLVVETGRQSVGVLLDQLLKRLPDTCKLSA